MKAALKWHLADATTMPSCGEKRWTKASANPADVTCHFCLGILNLRCDEVLRHYHRLRWLPYRLHGKDVWASCDEKGRLCVESDNVVTVVYALPARDNKRYSAHYRNLVPR